MVTVIKFSLALLMLSTFQNNSGQLILEYVQDVKNSNLKIEEVLTKYYPTANTDSLAFDAIFNMVSGQREYFQKIDIKYLEVYHVEKEHKREHLNGLTWEPGIFELRHKDDYLLTFLIKENRIVSTTILSKGKKKYFLIL